MLPKILYRQKCLYHYHNVTAYPPTQSWQVKCGNMNMDGAPNIMPLT